MASVMGAVVIVVFMFANVIMVSVVLVLTLIAVLLEKGCTHSAGGKVAMDEPGPYSL